MHPKPLPATSEQNLRPREDGKSRVMVEASHPSSESKTASASAVEPGGAVVIGGDYQGLGIVRSLGRRGIPVCVIDDERSIARFSRYTTLHHRVSSMREAKQTVQLLLEVG